MKTLPLIIKREFIAKIRNKSFIIMTFVSPLLFLLFIGLIAFLSTSETKVNNIGIHDESGIFIKEFKSNEHYNYIDVSLLDKKTLRDSLISKAYDGILNIPKVDNFNEYKTKITYKSDDSPSIEVLNQLESILNKKLSSESLSRAGFDTLAIEKTKIEVNLSLEKAESGEKTIAGVNEIKVFLGTAAGYLIMMFIIIYGNLVMRSVIEEKTNRIIEIIVSSVKPIHLMLGKIIGTTLAGLLQFLIWIAIGGVIMFISQLFFNVNPSELPASEIAPTISDTPQSMINVYLKEIFQLPLFTMIASFLLFFIGGYFLYSSIYAAIGAAVDNETDSQQFMFPIITPLMLAMYVGFFTVLKDPHGTIAMVFSFIPFTSPIVMLMRIPFGVPLWQIIISISILFATFLFIVWMSAKIYRIGILMYGKKPSWKEMYKWLKY